MSYLTSKIEYCAETELKYNDDGIGLIVDNNSNTYSYNLNLSHLSYHPTNYLIISNSESLLTYIHWIPEPNQTKLKNNYHAHIRYPAIDSIQ